MFGKKFLSAVVALVLVGQVGVFAQDSAVGSGSSTEIPVSGSELQRQPIKNADETSVKIKEGSEPKSPSLVGQGFVNAQTNIDSQPVFLNLLFIGLIFWIGMKFGEYRTRANQQLIKR